MPGFDQKKIVYQPNLKNNSHPVTRALALADLGTAGMGNYEELSRMETRFSKRKILILPRHCTTP